MKRATRRLLFWGGTLLIIATAALAGHAFAMQSGLERLRIAAQHRLDMVAAGLESDLARLEYLPSLLEMTPGVFALLDAPHDAARRDELNHYLQGVSATAGASNLYILDQHGIGLAASDWDKPGTPVGANLSFRPYMKDALAHGRGRFYGVGITSGQAGYYLSYALYQRGRARGVATVKVNLEEAERGWRKLPGEVLLVDERGVVILSSHDSWKFSPLAPLAATTLAEIASTRPYGNAPLRALGWQKKEELAAGGALVQLNGADYLSVTRSVNHASWRLLVLDDVAAVRGGARVIAVTAALGSAVLLQLLMLVAQRQRALRHKLANQAALQAAHDSLESKVALRTTELSNAVTLLGEEVEARKAIEADLRAMQNELVHAGKMAAFGQMSAGMVHELNQPLGALRTLSDNACVLLEKNRLADVHGNLLRMANLVDRLGRLTYQLKTFAYKNSQAREAIKLQDVLVNAQFLVSERLRDNKVELQVTVEPADLAAWADDARLEQVLVNLLGNAVDAMSTAPTRCLKVTAAAVDGERCAITVSDSGSGIRADILPRLFEPFITSKRPGAGLGLGLMISAHIVRELGGSLRAWNAEGAGACFMIELPRVVPAEVDGYE